MPICQVHNGLMLENWGNNGSCHAYIVTILLWLTNAVIILSISLKAQKLKKETFNLIRRSKSAIFLDIFDKEWKIFKSDDFDQIIQVQKRFAVFYPQRFWSIAF